MSKHTVRANDRILPEATNRRAVLGAILAGATIGATALPALAAPAPPELPAVDRRVLDLWNRRCRLIAALDRLGEHIDAAEAQLPKWARGGPKYVFAKGEIQIPGVAHPAGNVAWPELALDPPPAADALGWILVRPNVEDLYGRFEKACRSGHRNEATRVFLQDFLAHDRRVKEQEAEKDRVGLNRLEDRFKTGWGIVSDIEVEIWKYTEASVLALAVRLVIHIQDDNEDDHVLQAYMVSLRAIRPQLVGAIAEDADRVLAKEGEDA